MSQIIERIYDDILKRFLKTDLITVVLGPRQTGKTTSVRRIIQEIQDNRKLIINLDSSLNRDKIKSNETFILDSIESVIGTSFDEFDGRFYLFIDEAQKCPEVFEKIKILYDEFSCRLKIILTGSSVLEIMDRTSETLAGRIQALYIFPFTIAEASLYLGFGTFENTKTFFENLFSGILDEGFLFELLKKNKPRSQKVTSLIESLITRPLFPPTYSRIGTEDIERWIVDYIDTYIERDMRSLAEIGNIEGYRQTIIQLASRVSGLLNYVSLANDAGINQITVRKYIAIWEQSFTGKRISPFFLNTSTRIKKSNKISFVDNGLTWALTGFQGKEILKVSGKMGFLFENLIINEFFKYAALFPKKPQFYFWEKSQVREVDLVVESSGFVIPVEIKSGNSFNPDWVRGIQSFKEKHKNLPIPFSLVIYNGTYIKYPEDIYCLPAWILG